MVGLFFGKPPKAAWLVVFDVLSLSPILETPSAEKMAGELTSGIHEKTGLNAHQLDVLQTQADNF